MLKLLSKINNWKSISVNLIKRESYFIRYFQWIILLSVCLVTLKLLHLVDEEKIYAVPEISFRNISIKM